MGATFWYFTFFCSPFIFYGFLMPNLGPKWTGPNCLWTHLAGPKNLDPNVRTQFSGPKWLRAA